MRSANLAGWLMASPWLIGFLVFTLGPLGLTLWMSLTEWNLLAAPTFVGLDNYRRLFFEDPQAWRSAGITAVYSLAAVPLNLLAGFLLALLLNRNVAGMGFWRSVYYLPSIISGVAVALLWEWIFSPDFGVLNHVLSWFGVAPTAWLFDERWVLPSFLLMNLWSVGGSMLINLAGLQSIPTSLYEAAKVDGAGAVRRTFAITVPMMTPVLFLNLITGLIGSFQTFTNAYVMTGGGPNKASLFYMLYLYMNAFEDFRIGYASAMAWLLFAVVMALTLLVVWSGRYWVHYEGADRGR